MPTAGARCGTTVDSHSLQARLAARKSSKGSQPDPPAPAQPPTRQQLGVAMAIYRVARALHEWGRYDDASAFYQWALCVAIFGPTSMEDAQTVPLRSFLAARLSSEAIAWEEHPSEQDNMSALGPLGPPTMQAQPDLLGATPAGLRGASIEGHATTSQAFVVCALLEAYARLRSHEAKSEEAREMLERGIAILDGTENASLIDRSRLLAEMGWLLIVANKTTGPKGAVAVLMKAILAKTGALRQKYALEEPEVLHDTQRLSPEWRDLLEAAATEAAVPGAAEKMIDKSLPAAVNRLGVALTDKKNKHYLAAEFVFDISLRLHRHIFGSLHPATATVLGDYGNLFLREFKRRRKSSAAAEALLSTSDAPDAQGIPRNLSEPLVTAAAPPPSRDEDVFQRSQSLLHDSSSSGLFDHAKERLGEALVRRMGERERSRR